MAVLRRSRSSIDGTATTVPKLRRGRTSLEGVAAVTVNPLPDINDVEPETVVPFTATLATPGSPTWTFTQISGPAVTIEGTGATRSIRAPSWHVAGVPSPATVVIGVTATVGGATSPQRTFSIRVLPQLSWIYVGGSSPWVGARPPVML